MDVAWSGARAVVTGAAGFVGEHLVQHLAADGATVVGVDRRPGPGAPGTHLRADLGHTELHPGARAALAEADVVFHLVGATPAGTDPEAGGSLGRDDAGAAATVLAAHTAPRPTRRAHARTRSTAGPAAWPAGSDRRTSTTRSSHGAPRRGRRSSSSGCAATPGRRRSRHGGPAVHGPRPRHGVVGARRVGLGCPPRDAGADRRGRGALPRRRRRPPGRAAADRDRAAAHHRCGEPGHRHTSRRRRAARCRGASRGPRDRRRPRAVLARGSAADTCADTERLAALVGRVPVTDVDDLVRARIGAGVDLHSQVVSANMA